MEDSCDSAKGDGSIDSITETNNQEGKNILKTENIYINKIKNTIILTSL